jgi:hypothetical protein
MKERNAYSPSKKLTPPLTQKSKFNIVMEFPLQKKNQRRIDLLRDATNTKAKQTNRQKKSSRESEIFFFSFHE